MHVLGVGILVIQCLCLELFVRENSRVLHVYSFSIWRCSCIRYSQVHLYSSNFFHQRFSLYIKYAYMSAIAHVQGFYIDCDYNPFYHYWLVLPCLPSCYTRNFMILNRNLKLGCYVILFWTNAITTNTTTTYVPLIKLNKLSKTVFITVRKFQSIW